MKRAYKEQKTQMGVYQIRNTANDKVLIGSNLDLDKIWNRHQFELNMGSHRNKSLQVDWKSFGSEVFVFEILSEIEQKAENFIPYSKQIKELETTFIEKLKPYGELGYN